VLEYQTPEADGWWHVAGRRHWSRKQEDFSCCLRSNGAWPDSRVESNRILGASVVEDWHDHFLSEIPLPGAPLSVFFTGRYSVLAGIRLMRRASTVETRNLYWFGPREASKSRTSSCYLFVLRSMAITRWLCLREF